MEGRLRLRFHLRHLLVLRAAPALVAVIPPGSSPVDRDRSVTIAMNAGSEPAAGFDPLVAWGCGEHVHEPLIQSTLVTTNDKMEIVGDLATDHLLLGRRLGLDVRASR